MNIDTLLYHRRNVYLTKTTELVEKLVPQEYKSAAEYLKKLTIQGMRTRFPGAADTEVFTKKIDDELSHVVRNNYENYFLILYDFITWAKRHSIICTPGLNRSGVASSFVCYCLGITDINPNEYGLIFATFNMCEQFNLEVDALKIDNVIEYITKKYNGFCVAVTTSGRDEDFEYYCNSSLMSFSFSGLFGISILRGCTHLIQKTDESFYLGNIPDNDIETYSMIARGETKEVYQLNYAEVQELLRKAKPAGFDEMAALILLETYENTIAQQLSRKEAKSEIKYPDDFLKHILDPTFGYLIYEEQGMCILHEYAGFDFYDAYRIVFTITRKADTEREKVKKLFISESQKHGHDTVSAEKVWDFLVTARLYPKTINLNGAKLTYWQAYIKCHYPKVFATVVEEEEMSLENPRALRHIPSNTMREYLTSDKYREIEGKNCRGVWSSFPNWSVLQLATIAYLYMPKRACIRLLRSLKLKTCNANVKALLKSAAKDLSRNNYRNWKFSKKTEGIFKSYFAQSFSAGLFEEILFWPQLFKKGDVVKFRYKRRKYEYYIVMASPNYEKDLMLDYTDESCYVLSLEGGTDLLDEEKQGFWHEHISPAELEIVPDCSIPGKYKNLVEKLRNQFGNNNDDSIQIKPSAICTKEEMRQRYIERFQEATAELKENN